MKPLGMCFGLVGWWQSRRGQVHVDGRCVMRWTVIDCETSGLDARQDELLAIGGIAVVIGPAGVAIEPADSFEVLMRPRRVSDRDNILVHGIGREAQESGAEPGEALKRFIDWVQGAPLVAFHAPFDQAFIERACHANGILPPAGPWLDLAQLAPAVLPDRKLHTLDQWLEAFDMKVETRHCAPFDALGTAQLLAALYAKARPHPASALRELRQLAKAARWLG